MSHAKSAKPRRMYRSTAVTLRALPRASHVNLAGVFTIMSGYNLAHYRSSRSAPHDRSIRFESRRSSQNPSAGRGTPPYALTFGMEIHEDTAQFRRRALTMGIIGWSAASPPPRRTVLIPVGEYEMRA